MPYELAHHRHLVRHSCLSPSNPSKRLKSDQSDRLRHDFRGIHSRAAKKKSPLNNCNSE